MNFVSKQTGQAGKKEHTPSQELGPISRGHQDSCFQPLMSGSIVTGNPGFCIAHTQGKWTVSSLLLP